MNVTWPVVIVVALATAGIALLVDHLIRASIRKKRVAEARDRASAILEKAAHEAASLKETTALEARVHQLDGVNWNQQLWIQHNPFWSVRRPRFRESPYIGRPGPYHGSASGCTYCCIS